MCCDFVFYSICQARGLLNSFSLLANTILVYDEWESGWMRERGEAIEKIKEALNKRMFTLDSLVKM